MSSSPGDIYTSRPNSYIQSTRPLSQTALSSPLQEILNGKYLEIAQPIPGVQVEMYKRECAAQVP